mgnify:CR=1 FL=1
MLLALDENNHQHGGASTAQINGLPQSTVQVLVINLEFLISYALDVLVIHLMTCLFVYTIYCTMCGLLSCKV